MKKFYIHTMGCKSNQFETAVIIENLQTNGLEKVEKIEDADLYILNSCTVTHKSDNEALYLLRNAKHKNPKIFSIITGCVAQIEKEKLLENDYVDMVVGNDNKLNLYSVIKNINSEKLVCSDIMEQKDFNKVVLVDTLKTRASLKIQDGCDNRCTYCIIPFARGKSRSADIDFIVDQINEFSKHGFKEVVFTGIHIGLWGKDLGLKLIDLLKEIETKTKIERYRLGSLNPLEIDEELLNFLSKSKKFCPHFHLSLQSACDRTLKSMSRFYKTEDYLEQINEINEKFNLPFIGSDIIAGFAGESEEDFKTTCQNLEKSGLTQIHTFPYSQREGTVGATLDNQVDEKTKEKRAEIIKAISKKKLDEFIKKNIGTTREVLIEKHPDKKTGYLKGITRNYLTVLLNSKDESLLNTLALAQITEYKDGKVYGKLV